MLCEPSECVPVEKTSTRFRPFAFAWYLIGIWNRMSTEIDRSIGQGSPWT
jgi:hypothetical protein